MSKMSQYAHALEESRMENQDKHAFTIRVATLGTREVPYKERFYGTRVEADARCGTIWEGWDIDGRYRIKMTYEGSNRILSTIG